MSKKQRKILLTTTPLAVILALVLMTAVKVDRLQEDAEMLAATGKASINMLKEVAAGIEEGDPERILAAYAADYSSPSEGLWRPRRISEKDGVTTWDWEEEAPSGSRSNTGRCSPASRAWRW